MPVSQHSPGPASVQADAGAIDATLVQMALKGDRRAFDQLVVRYQQQAVGVSYGLLGNRSDAVEIVQDTFLKAWTSLGTLQKPEAFAGWLMRIVSNLSLNRRRGRKLRQSVSLDHDDASPFGDGDGTDVAGQALRDGDADPFRTAAGKELGGRLREAMGKLTVRQRLALELFTIQGLPQKQVADAMGCTVEAVKWHVFKARQRLRKLLEDCM